jgi:hypothetical protein
MNEANLGTVTSRQQRGDIDVLVIFVLIFLIVLSVFLWFHEQSISNEHRRVFNEWARECESQGGFTSETRVNWSDCIINGEPVVLRGYEQYQADKPR